MNGSNNYDDPFAPSKHTKPQAYRSRCIYL